MVFKLIDSSIQKQRTFKETFPKRSNENGYSERHELIPNFSHSDAVGDTEILGSFLEKYEITDVTWAHYYHNQRIEDCLQISAFKCTGGKYQCVPPHWYMPWFIWTRYPRETSELTLYKIITTKKHAHITHSRVFDPVCLTMIFASWIAVILFFQLAVIVGRNTGLTILPQEEIPFYPLRYNISQNKYRLVLDILLEFKSLSALT